MDVQTYINFGIFLALSFAWFAFVQTYIAMMLTRLPSIVGMLETVLVPDLLKQNQTVAHNLVKQFVIPVWKTWIGDLKPAMNTNTVFSGITLLAAALWMMGYASIWICIGISIPLLASGYTAYIIRKRQKLMQSGLDLVYSSTSSLLEEQKDASV